MSALHWIHRSDAEKEKIVYMDVHPIGGLVIIVSLLILNALISAAYTAIEDANKNEIEKRASDGYKNAKDVLYLQKLPGQYINIFRILILILSIAYSSILAGIWTPLVVYGFIMLSVLYPRKLAMYHATTYAYKLARTLKTFIIIFKPLLKLINININFFIRMTGIDPLELSENVTEDEIISMVNEGHEQGLLEAEEAEMISNIIEFNEKIISDIMTHRLKIAALDSEMTMEEALEFMMSEKYTRFPIYQDNIDNIIGIIHLRDVCMYYMDEDKKKLKITKAMREPYFVPDTLKIDVLFRDMQAKKMHIAVVFDEYGQIVGLVAMEDILEEIVGDIQDEYDDEADLITSVIGKDEFIVRGEADLEELADIIGINFDEEDLENYETVNGFIISKLEHIPKVDEMVQIEYYGFCFDIEEISNNVIQRVRIYRTVKEKPGDIKAAVNDMDI